MSQLKLTIGIATYDDHDMVAMTLHSLFVHHADVLPQCEIMLVDNHPVYDTPNHPLERATTRFERMMVWMNSSSQENHDQLIQMGQNPPWKPAVGKVTYIPMPHPTGTSAPRERIFLDAAAPNVMCIDGHVLLPSGVVSRLIDFYDNNPETNDFFQGPMVMDNHIDTQEGFDDLWRDGMWGTWMGDYRGKDVDGAPFDIEAMGLGLFSCRKDSWLRWPEGLMGFGGEEHNVHIMWRESGRRTLCLPWLRWWHLFRDSVKGTPYPNITWQRLRNYVLWAKHIGRINPYKERELLMRCKDHFVGRTLSPPITMGDWEELLTNPLTTTEQPSTPSKKACAIPPSMPGQSGRNLPPPQFHTVEGLYQWVKDTPRDLNEHWQYVKSLARKCRTITAFTKRREWLPVLAAGLPEKVVSYCTEEDPLTQLVHDVVSREQADNTRTITTGVDESTNVVEIEETDMLVLAGRHTAERVYEELTKFGAQVTRWILAQGTGAFGNIGEDGKSPGLMLGIRKYMTENDRWKIVYRTDVQYGMTLLSCDPTERTIERGPGHELHLMLEAMGIRPAANCQCIPRARKMDEWGPAKCREEKDTIVSWMKEAYALKVEELKKQGLGETASTAVKVAWGTFKNILSGFSLRAVTIEGLIEEAILRAERKDEEWASFITKLPAPEEALTVSICSECGHSETDATLDKCPLCGTDYARS